MKISKSKLTKETRPEEVLGLGFSTTSRRGRPANTDTKKSSRDDDQAVKASKPGSKKGIGAPEAAPLGFGGDETLVP